MEGAMKGTAGEEAKSTVYVPLLRWAPNCGPVQGILVAKWESGLLGLT